ncbi:elongation factor Ts [Abditibacteriota bacterium]|nr:elongation factor Ts [Abditibacteriota bacterium]
MATINAADVKKLRDMTGAGMMDCKKALVETGGDMEEAVTLLRKKGEATAVKRGDREAKEGAIGVYIAEDGASGAIIEVGCETDFVGKNEGFRALVNDLARNAALFGSSDIEALLDAKTLNNDAQTVREMITEAIATIGENIIVKRIALLGAQDGVIGSYVHSDGRKGALVVAEGASTEEAKTAAREIAMQAVALRAPYLNRSSVPADVIESEKAIYRAQAAEEGKPEAMQDKIAEGRLNKYYKENTLAEQAFIKDDKQSVQQVAKSVGVTIDNFIRFEVGQS